MVPFASLVAFIVLLVSTVFFEEKGETLAALVALIFLLATMIVIFLPFLASWISPHGDLSEPREH